MTRLFGRAGDAPDTLEALRERHGLLERLSRIQRSISHGAPLDEVFNAIALGASELLGDPVAGLRLVENDDPSAMRLVASVGLTDEQWDLVRTGTIGQGAGGRAIAEGELVVLSDYPEAADGIAQFGEFGVQNAMAAPVRVSGEVVGSLTVATFEPGRRYGSIEQEILEALAEHAGLALMDASLIDRRERSALERFHALVRHSSDLVLVVDGEGSISYATPSVGRALGLLPELLLGTTVLAHVHPADRPHAAAQLRAAVTRPGTMSPADWRIVPSGTQFAPGSWIHVEVLVTNLLEDPSVQGIVINARDTTERNRAEQERREQDARYRQIVDTTHDGVWVTDCDERTVFANRALLRMLGRAADEVLGNRPADFMDADQLGALSAAVSRRRRGIHERYELTFRRPDGSPLHAMVSATPMFENGTYSGSLALCSDITELVQARSENARLELQLRQAQELETLGRLAGHVAHDFNQVLAVILGHADLLKGAADDRMHESLTQIIDAAEHGAALARQLVSFSHRESSDPEVLDLNEVTRAVARMVEATTPAGVAVRLEADDDALAVRIGSTQLRQILMNLVDNAFDAMPAGGDLVLTTGHVTINGAAGGPASAPAPGVYARLEVADSGEGMSPDVVARAFEPAFTTKPSRSGTGLGLAIVHAAVQQASGHVDLRSVRDQGTTITILLPLAAAEPHAAVEPAEPEIVLELSSEAAARILLVEDDPAVLELTRRVLAERGFDVTAVSDADAAVAVAERQAIDLLVTDHTMPGMTGVELAALITKRQPDARAIVMSGYVAEVAAGHATDVAWLQKPFGATALLSAVGAELARP